ncbi:MAG: hypothetical protein K2P84_00050 [Undibacterium sp.]|nr:hypothetical protein [Undibacterium sp.]
MDHIDTPIFSIAAQLGRTAYVTFFNGVSGYLSATSLTRDNFHGGPGQIQGTVKQAHIPNDLPLRRRVRLHRKIDGQLICETWSTLDGAYAFNDVPVQPYYIITFDHTGTYNAVIADSIVPEIFT